MVKRFVVFHLRCVIFWVTEEFPTAARPVSSKFLCHIKLCSLLPAEKSRLRTVRFTVRTIQSSLSSVVMGPAATFGLPVSGSLTRRLRRPIEAEDAFPGSRFSPERLRNRSSTPGCRTIPFRRSKSFWSESKVH